jgi:hypothetical protein
VAAANNSLRKEKFMTSKRSVLSAASAILLMLALAGCGGGDGDFQTSATNSGGSSGSNGSGGSSGGSGGSGDQQGGSAPDAFINRVIAVINNTSETAEPENIDSVTATKPEDAEPVPVS